MNNKEFINALARRTGASADATQRKVTTVIEAMTAMIDDGENISISNFGTFEVKKRAERIIVNPGTGQRMLVPPKLVLGFKPSAQVRDTIRKGGGEQ